MTADTLGQRLAAYRYEHRLTLRDIAAQVGLSFGQVSRIERGLSDPLSATAARIEALIGAAPPPPDDWRAVAGRLNDENARLAAENQRLRATLRGLVLARPRETREPGTIHYSAGCDHWQCLYCYAATPNGQSFEHAADCAILRGRALVEGEKT